MSVKDFSTTPASNATVGSINFAEAQVPSTLNDSARQLMADLAELFALNKGGMTTGTVGGTADVITLATTPNPFQAAYAAGQHFLIKASGPNTVTGPTINVASLGAKTIVLPGTVALPIPAWSTNDMLLLTYDGTNMVLTGLTSVIGAADVMQRNAQTGTTYTYLTTDRGKHVTHSNAAAIAGTLPQANATTFGGGWFTIVENIGAGLLTITPTTSTINLAATLAIPSGEAYIITSDNTNYRALPLGLAYAKVNALTEDTTPSGSADFLLLQDLTTATVRKVKFQSFAATQAQMEAATAITNFVTPASVKWSPSAVKAWVQFDASSTVPIAGASLNFSSFTDNGVGDYTFNFTTAFSAATYAPSGSSQRPATNSGSFLSVKQGIAPTTTAYRFMTQDDAAGPHDTAFGAVSINGDFP